MLIKNSFFQKLIKNIISSVKTAVCTQMAIIKKIPETMYFILNRNFS